MGEGQPIKTGGFGKGLAVAAGLLVLLPACSGSGDVPSRASLSPRGSSSAGASTNDSSPTPIEADNRIAFGLSDGEEDSDRHIVTMNPDGSELTALTSGGVDDFKPAWSPDGTKIAFSRYEYEGDGSTNIWVMNADGSDPEKLTDVPGATSGPDWSPDGSRIVYDSNTDGDFDVYVMDSDGSNVVNLTNANSDLDLEPDWSPDGSKIAYWTSTSSFNDGDIWVVDSDGSNHMNLTASMLSEGEPAWSPDGSTLLFSGHELLDDGGRSAHDLYTMDADGSDVEQLTFGPEDHLSAAWTPDGERILYQDNDGSGHPDGYVIESDGSNETELTTGEGTFWSPALHPQFDSSSLPAPGAEPIELPAELGETGPGVSPTPAVEEFPTPDEEALLAHVPDAVAQTCARSEDPVHEPVAWVLCEPESGADEVQYNLYATVREMTRAYQEERNSLASSGGDCETDHEAEHAWFFRGDDKPAGRIQCYQFIGESWIWWTYTDLKILAWARRGDLKDGTLYNFWLEDAGPVA